MAKSEPSPKVDDETKPARPRKAPVDREIRKAANLLKEISGLYRDAADDFLNLNPTAAFSKIELSQRYWDLFETLTKVQAETETSSKLAEALES